MIAVGSNGDGRLEVFGQWADGTLRHIWQTVPNNGWSNWASLSGSVDKIAVGENSDGRLEAFATDANGVLAHLWQTAPNSGWTGWASLGGALRSLVVGRNGDGRLEVFGKHTSGAVSHIWQDSQSSTGWSSWGSFGALPGSLSVADGQQSLAVAQNADMRLEVFAIDERASTIFSPNELWHLWQSAPNNGWSGWGTLGAPSLSSSVWAVTVGRNANGVLDAFITSDFFLPWHSSQGSSGTWTTWTALGAAPGTLGDLVVASNADQRLELFAVGPDLALWHIWQLAPPQTGQSASWSNWESLHGPFNAQTDRGIASPVVGRNADGRLEVFAIGPDKALWHIWQTAPNSGWSSWSSLGGTLA